MKANVVASILLILVMFTSLAEAAVINTESFSKYKVDIDLHEDGMAHITKTIVIQNEIAKPIVPGIAYLKVFKKKESRFLGLWTTSISNVPLRVENLVVRDQNNQILSSETKIEKNISTISFSVWAPIPPHGNYTIRIEYDTRDLVETGILFSEVSYPLPASSIPIKKKEISVQLPEGSYLSYATAPSIINERLVWQTQDSDVNSWVAADLEYTKIPFPSLPVHGSLVFWLAILGIVIIYLIGFENLKSMLKKPKIKRGSRSKSSSAFTRRR